MKIQIPDNEDDARFAMAPMIDMVFLLLVFFMCASHLSQNQNVPLEIPTARKAVVPRNRPDRWVVNVQKDGSVYNGMTPTDVATLARDIKEALSGQPALKIYLRADAQASHKEVKKVMNALAEVGVDDFIFGVYIPGSETVTP